MYSEDLVDWFGYLFIFFGLLLTHMHMYVCVCVAAGNLSAMPAKFVTWWVSQYRRSHMAAHPSFAFQLDTALAICLCN